MKKTYILILMALLSFTLLACNSHSSKKKTIIEDNIELEVSLEQNTSSRYPLDIIFKLTNLSDTTVYYDNLAVPINDNEKTSLNIFHVNEDSIPLTYKGPMVELGGISFTSLAPGETYTATVSLDKIYTVTKGTHHYQISYMHTISAKTSDGKTEVDSGPDTPLKPDELAPKDHTSREVNATSNTLEFEANIKKIRKPY